MLDGRVEEETQRTKLVKKLAEIFDVSFDSLKGIDGGLEEIVDLLRQ